MCQIHDFRQVSEANLAGIEGHEVTVCKACQSLMIVVVVPVESGLLSSNW